jgi:hypothetical protein
LELRGNGRNAAAATHECSRFGACELYTAGSAAADSCKTARGGVFHLISPR